MNERTLVVTIRGEDIPEDLDDLWLHLEPDDSAPFKLEAVFLAEDPYPVVKLERADTCPTCGEKLEHHELVTVRRHGLSVDEDGMLLVDAGYTDSFDDDGEQPHLWCPNCMASYSLHSLPKGMDWVG